MDKVDKKIKTYGIILGVILFVLVLYLAKANKRAWITGTMLFAFIGLFKEADALLHIYKALTLGIFVKRFSLGHFPNVITHHRRM